MEQIKIVEVGPRDGFQNISRLVKLEDKLEVIRLLYEAGVRSMEIGSFVNPKAIPQMADMQELSRQVQSAYKDKMECIALVPNLRGAENAVNSGYNTVTYVTSVSEKHNLANVRKTPTESMSALKDIMKVYPELKVRLDLATSFGCPFEGAISTEQVLHLAETAIELGVREIILCDTIGIAGPRQVSNLSEAFMNAFPDVTLGLHLHDTRGMGIVNIYAGYQNGVRVFETSVGGLGGCPFAPGAAGNTATEDLLYMAQQMGLDTAIDFEKYLSAVRYVRDYIQPQLTGRQMNLCRA